MRDRILLDVVKNKELIECDKETTVFEAVKIMDNKCVGSLIVTDAKGVFGIFTERDLMVRVIAKGLNYFDTKLSEVSTKNIITLEYTKPFCHAIYLMRINGIRHIPVTKSKKVIGVVSARDALGDEIILVEKELIHENELFEMLA